MHYYLHAMKIFHYTLLYHNKKPKYLLRCCVTKYNTVNFDIITVSNHLRECLLYVLDVSWEVFSFSPGDGNRSSFMALNDYSQKDFVSMSDGVRWRYTAQAVPVI